MKRVVVFGTTGSGKTWLAKRLGARHGLRVIELDALYWGRDWQPAPLDLFRHRVEREIRDGDWVVVGIYGQVRDLTWGAADTLVWLDLPFPLVFWRLLKRTIWRAITRENLWGTGNRESFVRTFFTRNSILWWAIRTHVRNRRRFTVECESYGKGRRVVRLRSPKDVENFLLSS